MGGNDESAGKTIVKLNELIKIRDDVLDDLAKIVGTERGDVIGLLIAVKALHDAANK